MKSQKDSGFSLRVLLATLRDAEQILSFSLVEDEHFIVQFFNTYGVKGIVFFSQLGKAVESSLITGNELVFDEKLFPAVEGEKLPQFLHSLLSPLFSSSGRPKYILVPTNSTFGPVWSVVDSDGSYCSLSVAKKNAHYVLLLRQLLLSFSKSQDLECEVSEDAEWSSFIGRLQLQWFPKSGMSNLLVTARLLLRNVLMESGDANARIHARFANWVSNPFGRHGPGAVASREKGRQKWDFTVDTLRLARQLFEDSYGTIIGEEFKGGVEYTARSCMVPKDFRGHRIICVEPKELQFAQQGLLQVVEDLIHSHPLTRRHISLINQGKSFRMSQSYDFATIDLKDASDMISLRLAKLLLPKQIFELVTRYRSTHIFVNGQRVRSNAFLTMGNALCFPFETLIFWALTAASILTEDGKFRPDDGFLKHVAHMPIRVFGDDIIVPLHTLNWVIGSLSDCGLIVNRSKTCGRTLVRESCGSWFYAKADCRIQRFKYCQTLDLQSWISLMPAIPQLRENGLLQTAKLIEDVCDEIYPVPSSCKRDGVTERNSHALRFNAELQRMEYKLPCFALDKSRALPGRIKLTAWWASTATRFTYTNASNSIKYVWTAL